MIRNQCDYIYLRWIPEGDPDPNPHRKPENWHEVFGPGEFVDFIAPMTEILNLYHSQSVDPWAVAIAFNELREQHPDTELDIISMERREMNREQFLLQAETNPTTALSELHSQYFRRYNEIRTLSTEALQALLVEKEEENQPLASVVSDTVDRPTLYTEINAEVNGGINRNPDDAIPEATQYDLKLVSFRGDFASEDTNSDMGSICDRNGRDLMDDGNTRI